MTRAKDDLHLIVPQRFFIHGQHAQGDRHVYASRTRFIPETLLPMFDRTAWPLAAAAQASPANRTPQMDIRATDARHVALACRASSCPERPGPPRHFLAPSELCFLKAGNVPRATAATITPAGAPPFGST